MYFDVTGQEKSLIWQPGPHYRRPGFTTGNLTLHIEIPHLADWGSTPQTQLNSLWNSHLQYLGLGLQNKMQLKHQIIYLKCK